MQRMNCPAGVPRKVVAGSWWALAFLVVGVAIAGCRREASGDGDAAPVEEIDPLAPCETCLERACVPCKSGDCVPERRSRACEEARSANKVQLAKMATGPEKHAFCKIVLEQCDALVAEVEKVAKRPTPESDAVDYARYYVKRAIAQVPDTKLRRKALACEIHRLIRVLDRGDRVSRQMLETRPKRYVGRPISLDGSVFQVWDNEERGETAFFIRVGRNNVYVIYPEVTDFVKRQQVRIFGYVAGDYSYKSVAGYQLTIPKVAAVAIGSRRSWHPYRFHCPDDLPRVSDGTASSSPAPEKAPSPDAPDNSVGGSAAQSSSTSAGQTSRVPSVRTGSAEIRGSLSREVIRRYIRRHINQIRFCYEQQLAARPDLAGRVAIRFTISASGAVSTASVASSTLGNPAAEQCVARAVQRIAFPQPEGGGPVIVTYPFRFQSAEGG